MFCKYCGSELDGNSVKCGTCGANIDIYDGGQSFFEDGDFAEWSKKGAAMPRTKILDDFASASPKTGEPSRRKKRKKKKTNLIIILCASGVVVLALIAAAVIMLLNGISARNEAMQTENIANEIINSLKIKSESDIMNIVTEVWTGEDDPNTNDQNTNDQNTNDQNTNDQNTDDPNTNDQNTNDQNTDDPDTDDQNTDDQNTDDQNTDSAGDGGKQPVTPPKPDVKPNPNNLTANNNGDGEKDKDGSVDSSKYSVTIDGEKVDFEDCEAEINEGVLYVSVNCILESLEVKDFNKNKNNKNIWQTKEDDPYLEIYVGTTTIYNKMDGAVITLEYKTYEKKVGKETHVYVPVVEFLKKWGEYKVTTNKNKITASTK